MDDVLSALEDASKVLKKERPDLPPESCPIIDRVIKAVKTAIRLANEIERINDDPVGMASLADEIDTELRGLEDDLEYIRTINSDLRQCHDELKERIIEAEGFISDGIDYLEEEMKCS